MLVCVIMSDMRRFISLKYMYVHTRVYVCLYVYRFQYFIDMYVFFIYFYAALLATLPDTLELF